MHINKVNICRFFSILILILIICSTLNVISVNNWSNNVVNSLDLYSEYGTRCVLGNGSDWWPMYRHDEAHTGYSSSKGPTTNNILWTFETEGNILSSPAVYEGRVYVGSCDLNMYCLDAHTGERLWNFSTGDMIISSPSIYEGCVFFGSTDDKVYCVDAVSGDLIWDSLVCNITSSPTVVEEKVYVGSYNSSVWCLDSETGKFIWNYSTVFDVDSSPAVVGNRVYIGCGEYGKGGMLYCLDAVAGEKIWSSYVGGIIQSSPVVDNNRVFVGYSIKDHGDGGVVCVDAEDGSILWKYPTEDSILFSSPSLYNNRVFVGSADGYIYCLDAVTGVMQWRFQTCGAIDSSPAIADGKVYVGSYDSYVYCINADNGSLIWNYATGSSVFSSPAVASSCVYIGSGDHIIYCFRDDFPPKLRIIRPENRLYFCNFSYGEKLQLPEFFEFPVIIADLFVRAQIDCPEMFNMMQWEFTDAFGRVTYSTPVQPPFGLYVHEWCNVSNNGKIWIQINGHLIDGRILTDKVQGLKIDGLGIIIDL